MARVRKALRQWRDYALLRLVFLVARPLPFGALQRLGRGLGVFCWHLLPFRRAVVLENLAATVGRDLPPRERRRLGRAFYAQLGTTLLEFCGYWRLGRARTLALVDAEGAEHLDAVAGTGRGALLVSGHFGNWELLGAWLAARGHAVDFLVKTQSNQRVDRLQNRLRARAGVGIIRSGPSVRAMVRALRTGGLVGLLGDQDAGPGGLFLDFLGQPASVFRGTAQLAWKLQVPVVTGFLVRQPDGRHRAVIGPPITVDPSWDEATAVRRITAEHTQRLAAMVRRYPDHYFWVHRRWKTRPLEDPA